MPGGRDTVESSWCHCANPVREPIGLFGTSQCGTCGRPFAHERSTVPCTCERCHVPKIVPAAVRGAA